MVPGSGMGSGVPPLEEYSICKNGVLFGHLSFELKYVVFGALYSVVKEVS